MASHDKNGRQYAKLSEVKIGSILETDDGFDCLTKGAKYTVYGDMVKGPDSYFINCKEGNHNINGQDNGDGYLVGLY